MEAGFGATATAVLDQNGSVTAVQMVTGGQGYTSPPLVQVTPSNGVLLTATIDDQIVNIANRVPETDRYYIEWVPNFPGHYLISVEAVDNDNTSTLHSTEHNVIVTPKDSSKAPTIRLLGPTNGNTYTTGSELRAYAQASDIDGGLDWIKFYVNIDPIDGEQPATNLQTGDRYPYSQKFTLPDEGTYTFLMAMDNSGNCVMSRISTITTTNSSGNFPSVSFTGTTSLANARIRTQDIDANGGIESYLIENHGNGYVSNPEIRISGDGFGADMRAMIEQNPLNPNFGKVVDIQIDNPGYGYTTADIELLGGFTLLKPSGETALCSFRL